MSSIVRKLYYDRCHGVTRFPRVVIGTPDSWDTAISLSGGHGYGSCTWSPCGQFIAAPTVRGVEIRNPLTFELLTVLQSIEYTLSLAYSPDGRSLAQCDYSGGIVILDIQTGGVANKIRCNEDITSLVWSLDGSMVAVTFGGRRLITGVETFNIFSGAQLLSEQFEAETSIYLWAHDKSFRLVKAVVDDIFITYTISEIGPTLIKIESSSLTTGFTSPTISEITFSPSTHHLAVLGYHYILVYDIRTSHRLLDYYGSPTSLQFSPDGSHFACGHDDRLWVFQCTPDSYTLLWEYPFYQEFGSSLQFSPTSSSILSQHDGILQVRRLSDVPIASETLPQYTHISRSGRRIATAHRYSTTVSIIDLHSQAPPQYIDTGFSVWNLDIAGNVLVATGPNRATGWLLTEEGKVTGVFDDQRASSSDSEWTLHVPSMGNDRWDHSIEGVVGTVQVGHCDPQQPLYYHIETGDVLEFPHELRNSRPTFPQLFVQGRLCHPLPTTSYDTLLKDRWLVSNGTSPEAAWVIDPEGMRRFWVPVEWRKSWLPDGWHPKFTTLLGSTDECQSIVVKF